MELISSCIISWLTQARPLELLLASEPRPHFAYLNKNRVQYIEQAI